MLVTAITKSGANSANRIKHCDIYTRTDEFPSELNHNHSKLLYAYINVWLLPGRHLQLLAVLRAKKQMFKGCIFALHFNHLSLTCGWGTGQHLIFHPVQSTVLLPYDGSGALIGRDQNDPTCLLWALARKMLMVGAGNWSECLWSMLGKEVSLSFSFFFNHKRSGIRSSITCRKHLHQPIWSNRLAKRIAQTISQPPQAAGAARTTQGCKETIRLSVASHAAATDQRVVERRTWERTTA